MWMGSPDAAEQALARTIDVLRRRLLTTTRNEDR
jgi:hypothetical protein